jgi:YhcH/YjgK/YiaL family protein
MKKYPCQLSLVLLFVFSFVCSSAQEFKPLFNGRNLDGWYPYFNESGKNMDTGHVFSVADGLLHISGKQFGYIVTERSYSDFDLVAEFKWGEKKYPPRENDKRDNGIVYYVAQEDHVWPRGIECQIQEGDCGDFWLIDSVTVVIDGVRTASTKNTRAFKKRDNEKPTGEWNRIEVIAQNGKLTHIVNGVVVNEGTDANLRSGRILIQSEGAEAYYRKIEIKELGATAASGSANPQTAALGSWTPSAARKWFRKKEWLNGAALTPHESINQQEFARQYHANKAYWDMAFTFLKEHDLQALAKGKYPIDGDNVYATVTEDPSKDFDKTNWESHRKYIDLQCVITGEERMGVCPVASATVTREYDEKKDLANYSAEGKQYDIPAGTFVIFFPGDAHRPNITPGGNKVVKKIVIKIRVAE